MKIIKNIILVILIVGVAYNLFTNNGIKTDVAMYNHKIDSIQKEVDSIENENKILNQHITQVDNEINKVEGNVTNVYKNINEIKNNTHEKVTAVNDYTIHDLLKFFSDRYESNVGETGHDSTSKTTDGKVSH
jgi:peptidoglycan hydrolase CwlO-like protein